MRFFSSNFLRLIAMLGLSALTGTPLFAQQKPDCTSLPDHTRLRSILQSVVKEGAKGNSGLGNQEWAAVVNRDGIVCAIVYSGTDRDSSGPGVASSPAKKQTPRTP